MKNIKVTPIQNGTVIDHIDAGMALKVLKILGITGQQDSIVSVLLSVTSRAQGRKDVVKVENRELRKEEVSKLAIIAPGATINIIRMSKVVKKVPVELPGEVRDVLACPNPQCVCNMERDVTSRALLISRKPIRYKCYYCEREITELHKCIII